MQRGTEAVRHINASIDLFLKHAIALFRGLLGQKIVLGEISGSHGLFGPGKSIFPQVAASYLTVNGHNNTNIIRRGQRLRRHKVTYLANDFGVAGEHGNATCSRIPACARVELCPEPYLRVGQSVRGSRLFCSHEIVSINGYFEPACTAILIQTPQWY